MEMMTQAQHDRGLEIVRQCKKFMDWVYDEMEDSGLLADGFQVDMHLMQWGPEFMQEVAKHGPWFMNVSLRKDSSIYKRWMDTEMAVTKNAAQGEWRLVHDAEFIYTAALSDGTGEKAKGESGSQTEGKELPPDGLWLRADYDPDLLGSGRDLSD